MVRVEVSSRLAVGDPIEIRIHDYARSSDVSKIQVTLGYIAEFETSWKLGKEVTARVSGDDLVGTVPDTSELSEDTIYEVRSLEFRSDENTIATLEAGRDFQRTFFEIPVSGQSARPSSEIRLSALDIEEKRKILLARPLGRISDVSARLFRAVSIVEGLLLTQTIQMFGYRLLPIPPGAAYRGELDLINGVLYHLGWKVAISPETWMTETARKRPIVAFDFPRIYALSNDDARAVVMSLRDQALNVLAVHRLAAGVPLAMLIEDTLSEERWFMHEETGYLGNVLGGFISGENPPVLLAHSRAVAADPRVRLWASLYRDARAKSELNSAFLKFWTILEVMAVALVPDGQLVTDFDSNGVLENNKPARTGRDGPGPRASAYVLLKSRSIARQASRTMYVVPQSGETLWETVAIWNALRNAAVHFGGFRANDPAQRARPWYKAAMNAYTFVTSQDPEAYEDPNRNPYLRALQRAVTNLLHWELDASAGIRPNGPIIP